MAAVQPSLGPRFVYNRRHCTEFYTAFLPAIQASLFYMY